MRTNMLSERPRAALAATLAATALGLGALATPPSQADDPSPPPSQVVAPAGVAPEAGEVREAARSAAPRRAPELQLPRIPWEGGPAYYKQFAKADGAGWDRASFFPVVLWFNGISTDAEARYDRTRGFNTYVGMWEGTDYALFEDNDVYWIGDGLNSTFRSTSRNWVGSFLGDEYDGGYGIEEGLGYLGEAEAANDGTGRIGYANFTQMVISEYMPTSLASQYVNDFTDVVSLDMYWYTIPFCDWMPYQDIYAASVAESTCRSASSYGRTMDSLRKRDALDGVLQPMWNFVEILNGGPGEGPFLGTITPGQLRGAVMSSVINEARGIVYFNQSLSGPCTSSGVVRQAQVEPGFCGAPQVAAASRVNNQIHRLARVINTQSYRYRFGSGLDTMLKARGKYVYIFSMVKSGTGPGSRTYRLPREVEGRKIKVLFENRSITVGADRRFTDTFDAEYSYHVYRVRR